MTNLRSKVSRVQCKFKTLGWRITQYHTVSWRKQAFSASCKCSTLCKGPRWGSSNASGFDKGDGATMIPLNSNIFLVWRRFPWLLTLCCSSFKTLQTAQLRKPPNPTEANCFKPFSTLPLDSASVAGPSVPSGPVKIQTETPNSLKSISDCQTRSNRSRTARTEMEHSVEKLPSDGGSKHRKALSHPTSSHIPLFSTRIWVNLMSIVGTTAYRGSGMFDSHSNV